VRFGCVSVASVVRVEQSLDDRCMDESLKVTIAFTLIGAAGIAAGILGMRLPAGDRIAAGLALVVGAGAGVMALAIGTQLSSDSPTPDGMATVFLIASVLGFVATVVGLALLWRWTAAERG
jgi:hypothetical protein